MNKDQNHIDNLFDKARNQQPITSFEESSEGTAGTAAGTVTAAGDGVGVDWTEVGTDETGTA